VTPHWRNAGPATPVHAIVLQSCSSVAVLVVANGVTDRTSKSVVS
jgi:hypothetical protein